MPQKKNTLAEKATSILSTMQDDLNKIILSSHHEPFSVLGNQAAHRKNFILFYSPGTKELSVSAKKLPTFRFLTTDFFVCTEHLEDIEEHYLLTRTDSKNNTYTYYDPYSFKPELKEFDLDLFSAGKHLHIYRILGSHPKIIDNIEGVLFATWAPNAARVSVVGDFNGWDGRRNPMRSRGKSGVWELFIPSLGCDTLYKFEIRNRDSGSVVTKSDPYGQQHELRPHTASVVLNESAFEWQDKQWMQARVNFDWMHEPISIYECHLGSWQRDENEEFLNYRELAHRLVDYVIETGFTHIELLPVTEHPFDGSWGYQTTGYYAATSRFGSAEDFRYFVNYCHLHNVGVLLDWVPGHFPKDKHGLARFDGSALYEHEDPKRGEHRDWGTLIYNYNRNEVKNFLISSAVFWLEEYHIDGLRVDAVASMLYLDYSRENDDWIPNQYGGNENIEAIEFLKELNIITHANFPGTITMAEESTAWPQVTSPTYVGGLGFSMKWNMGWMHDTLNYFSHDPLYRKHYHERLTFGLLYLFSENFILPFSHDEVVHEKSSMLYKMPGDEAQRFANLRLLYTYMYTYPGKKLLFMGCEFGQGEEWNHDKILDWYVLQYPKHFGIKKLISDLNELYKTEVALYKHDFEPRGFEWIDCQDKDQSVLSYLRMGDNDSIVVIFNFTPVERSNYRVGVPGPGEYKVILNSDSDRYSGSNTVSISNVHSENVAWMNRSVSVTLDLPPLAAIVLKKIT
jgi:1,4-alpha-glucan branching enzyme